MNGISEELFLHIEEIQTETAAVFEELMESAHLEKGDILVVGCSSSEVASHGIGSYSSAEIGQAIFAVLQEACQERGIYLAATSKSGADH